MEELKIFGKNVRRKRESMNQTLIWLSKESLYNRNSLATIEVGEHDLLLSTAINIAKALDINFVEMLGRNCDISNSSYVDDDFYFIFCENVKRKMKSMNVTQSFFHSRINIEAPNINRILNMKVKSPKLGTLIKIADELDTDVQTLFTRKES